ncbi:MAG: hypothetical protein H7211_06560, partial [Aquabacterium sp.]|nr:hypothetical protein [Ferruginibacter sp.]
MMKQYLIFSAFAVMLLSACNSSKKEGNATLNDKKTDLEKLKGEKNKLDSKISGLEKE